ncbi:MULTISPECIES: hypothetical protein [unclassified Peribacillus]|uniref:hypothetical protein n=1 Tax=unclassified Peribacillus TaxID=2675266 RepID=UPI003671983B
MDVLKLYERFWSVKYPNGCWYNIASPSTMDKWLKQLGENGIDDLEPNKKGRPSMKKETKKIPVEGSIRGFTG